MCGRCGGGGLRCTARRGRHVEVRLVPRRDRIHRVVDSAVHHRQMHALNRAAIAGPGYRCAGARSQARRAHACSSRAPPSPASRPPPAGALPPTTTIANAASVIAVPRKRRREPLRWSRLAHVPSLWSDGTIVPTVRDGRFRVDAHYLVRVSVNRGPFVSPDAARGRLLPVAYVHALASRDIDVAAALGAGCAAEEELAAVARERRPRLRGGRVHDRADVHRRRDTDRRASPRVAIQMSWAPGRPSGSTRRRPRDRRPARSAGCRWRLRRSARRRPSQSRSARRLPSCSRRSRRERRRDGAAREVQHASCRAALPLHSTHDGPCSSSALFGPAGAQRSRSGSAQPAVAGAVREVDVALAAGARAAPRGSRRRARSCRPASGRSRRPRS